MENKHYIHFNDKGISDVYNYTDEPVDSTWVELPLEFIGENNQPISSYFKLENGVISIYEYDVELEALKVQKLEKFKLSKELKLSLTVSYSPELIGDKCILSTSQEAVQCYQYGFANDGIKDFYVLINGIKTPIQLTKEDCNIILKSIYEAKNKIFKDYFIAVQKVESAKNREELDAINY